MRVGRPLLSVLVPAYNAEKYMEAALKSILDQTFKDFELLIADDASTDKTKAIIDAYSSRDNRLRVFHNEKNIGKTATVNKLFKQSTGDFITIHDADDLSILNRFEKQLEAFKKDKDLTLCGTSFLTIDEAGYVLEYNKMSSCYEEISKSIFECSQFHGPTMMMKRAVLDEVGEIYRPYFKDNYEDTDLAFRIAERHKAYNLPDYLYLYRILDSSLCRKKVDVRNRNLYKVISYLGWQRKAEGVDALMLNRPEQIEQYLYDITASYRRDPAQIYREAASYYFYWRLYKKSLSAALKGFLVRPFDFKNLRTVLYILRKKLFNHRESQKHYKEILF